MLIKCPRCSTTAKIGEAQEGAKVRCSSCERVYVARPLGERGSRAKTGVPPAAIIGVMLVVVVLILMVVVNGSDDPPAQASAPKKLTPLIEEQVEESIDPYSFEGEVTQYCIEMHRLALESDRGLLRFNLSGDHLLASEKDGVEADSLPFSSLTTFNQQEHLKRWAEDLVSGPSSAFIKNFKAYDCDVAQVNQKTAKVKLSVSSRDAGDASQHVVIWDLVSVAGKWKIAGWEKYKQPTGIRTEAYASSTAGVEKVQLPDGSVVVEREAEALKHLESSSPELVERIEALYAVMVDLDLTRESNAARSELIAIGKPVVPKLLTGLFETHLDTEEKCIKANIIVVALRNITGKNFGYQPMALAGGKNTEEYRMSSVRQWFAWWYRFGPKFLEKRESKDALEDYIELTDKERRDLERDK